VFDGKSVYLSIQIFKHSVMTTVQTSKKVSILTILNWNTWSKINISSRNVRTLLVQDWHYQFQSQETLIELQQFTLTMLVETFRNFRMNLLVWNLVLTYFVTHPIFMILYSYFQWVSSSQPQLLWGMKSGIIFVCVMNKFKREPHLTNMWQ
jgi:hypothetical protein